MFRAAFWLREHSILTFDIKISLLFILTVMYNGSSVYEWTRPVCCNLLEFVISWFWWYKIHTNIPNMFLYSHAKRGIWILIYSDTQISVIIFMINATFQYNFAVKPSQCGKLQWAYYRQYSGSNFFKCLCKMKVMMRIFLFYGPCRLKYKEAVMSQGNSAVPQLFFSV